MALPLNKGGLALKGGELIEIQFDVTGVIPFDHEYWLFSALCREIDMKNGERLPQTKIHGNRRVQIARIQGEVQGEGRLRTLKCGPMFHSVIRIRGLDWNDAQELSWLRIHENVVGLSAPRWVPLQPSPSLLSSLVLFPNVVQREEYEQTLREQLWQQIGIPIETDQIELSPHPRSILIPKREEALFPGQRNHLIKPVRKLGWGVKLRGLTSEQSLKLQAEGTGASTRWGCGFWS